MRKIRFGILSTARIARLRVIPAIADCQLATVDAICSRNMERAQEVASELQIPIVHGDYESLIEDDRIDAIYNPLPNHMHVEWSIRAIEAGKHVLCEKPLGLDAHDAQRLLNASAANPGVKVMEAFMYRFHPQWQRAREIVQAGGLGRLSKIHTDFSFEITHADNIRLRLDMGGGALMDIGCYGISGPRFLLEREPLRVRAHMRYNSQQVDLQCDGELDFGQTQHASFHACIDGERKQSVRIEGSEGSMTMPMAFGPPPEESAKIQIEWKDGRREEIVVPPANQFGRQVDAFSRAILQGDPVPTPLSDAIANMKVIDAIRQSDGIDWKALQ